MFYIYEALFKLKENIMKCINKTHKPYVIQFYSVSEELITELRSFIYLDKSQKLIKIEPINSSIYNTSWNIKTFIATESSYVERILH